MRMLSLKAILAAAAVLNLNVAAFQSVAIIERRSFVSRSSTTAIASQSVENDAGDDATSLGRRTFFSSVAQKAAVTSLSLSLVPSSVQVANAAESFPKIYKPAPHSMDGKLGKCNLCC